MLSIRSDTFTVAKMKALNERVREVREELGFSQEKFAEALGVERLAVQRWERGLVKPRADSLHRFEDLTGCRLSWLLSGTEPKRLEDEEPPAGPISEATLLGMFARQQELLAQQQAMMSEQQAMLERQRQDVARLTELLARQQDIFESERQFQQKLVSSEMDKLRLTVERLEGEVARARGGRGQLLDSPTRPGRVGER